MGRSAKVGASKHKLKGENTGPAHGGKRLGEPNTGKIKSGRPGLGRTQPAKKLTDAAGRRSQRSSARKAESALMDSWGYAPRITHREALAREHALCDDQVFDLSMLAMALADVRCVAKRDFTVGPMALPENTYVLSSDKSTNRTRSRFTHEYSTAMVTGWRLQPLHSSGAWHYYTSFRDLDADADALEAWKNGEPPAETAPVPSGGRFATPGQADRPVPRIYVVNTWQGRVPFDVCHVADWLRECFPTPHGRTEPSQGALEVWVALGTERQRSSYGGPGGIGCGLASGIIGILIAAGEFSMKVDDYSDRDIRRLSIDYSRAWTWYQTAVTSATRRPTGGRMQVDPTNAANAPSGAAGARVPMPPFTRIPRPETPPERNNRWYIRRFPAMPSASTEVQGIDPTVDAAVQDVGFTHRISKIDQDRSSSKHYSEYAGRRSIAGLARPQFPKPWITRPNFTSFRGYAEENGGKAKKTWTCDRCDKPGHDTAECPTYPTPKFASDRPTDQVRSTEAADVFDDADDDIFDVT